MKFKLPVILILFVCAGLLIFYLHAKQNEKYQKPLPIHSDSMIQIYSSAFLQGEDIPKKFTCRGDNVNPPLSFDRIPESAKSLVLIVDDPDAPMGVWTHWLVWNIDPKADHINEHTVPDHAVSGTNDFGTESYGGPCPPFGTHHYYFRLYALDTVLSLPKGSKRKELEKVIQGHVLEQGELMGIFSKT